MWNIHQSSNNKKRDGSQALLMRQVGIGLTIEPHIRQIFNEDLYSYTQHLLATMEMCVGWIYYLLARPGWSVDEGSTNKLHLNKKLGAKLTSDKTGGTLILCVRYQVGHSSAINCWPWTPLVWGYKAALTQQSVPVFAGAHEPTNELNGSLLLSITVNSWLLMTY